MKNIAVIGAGTMGNGIAHTFAQFGYKVSLIDISQDSLDKGIATITKNLDRMLAKEKITETQKQDTLDNITTYTDLKKVPNMRVWLLKRPQKMKASNSIYSENWINMSRRHDLATNTSSIPITKIAGVTERPEQVIGMHFMNPVPIMKLVEVIRGYNTSDETTKQF